MKRILPIALAILLSACGSDTVDDDADLNMGPGSDMSVDDTGDSLDMTTRVDQGSDSGSSSDAGDSDLGTFADMGSSDLGDASDMGGSIDMNSADMSGSDMDSDDMNSADAGRDLGTEMGSGGYDTTGWTMKRWTKSESASSGTPDSYFFDVDSGSPLSASIVGGGSGTWSVNVFGGMTNQLHCTGNSSCQIMLNPLDTVVIITAITTDIGGYTLTVDYAGMGPR